jgi:hypothetical protein
MAVKAIEKELNGQKGYPEYIGWWQKAFYFHNPKYHQRVAGFNLSQVCSGEELDYLYRLFQGRVGWLQGMVSNNLDLVKRDRPELYEKLAKGIGVV